MTTVVFIAEHRYYIPQFVPVANKLRSNGVKCVLVAAPLCPSDLNQLSVQFDEFLNIDECTLTSVKKQNPQWVVLGNHHPDMKEIKSFAKTALLYHGIGVKRCYYGANLSECDVRFVEGPFRKAELEKLYPQANFVATGFAKLDPMLDGSPMENPLLNWFDIQKQTLLYAPTFYPSSIEKMARDWPNAFSDFNIVIKPHQFSLTKSAYESHRALFRHWSGFGNVHVVNDLNQSLLPLMKYTDLLISDASSVLFEYAALDKPIIWCDFLKLRWSYRGVFSYRYKKRMDDTIDPYKIVAQHVSRYSDLLSMVKQELANPKRLSKERRKVVNELLGKIDGKAASRVADYLLSHG